MLDRADKFEAGTEIQGKSASELCAAIDTTWLSVFGPFRNLIIDGEKRIDSDEARQVLGRKGIKLSLKAPGQHARISSSVGRYYATRCTA